MRVCEGGEPTCVFLKEYQHLMDIPVQSVDGRRNVCNRMLAIRQCFLWRNTHGTTSQDFSPQWLSLASECTILVYHRLHNIGQPR